jgi:hypothetical protein
MYYKHRGYFQKMGSRKNQNIRGKEASLPLLEYGENVNFFLLLLEYRKYVICILMPQWAEE